MTVSDELISRYADGEATAEEALRVEEAVREDPGAALALDDFRALAELFGHVEPEEPGDALRQRLHALRPVPRLASFETIPASAPARRSWPSWAAAAAAAVLAAVGIQGLLHRPEVVLHDYLSQRLGPEGEVVATVHFARKRVRAGDLLDAGGAERISYRAADGSVVVLMPRGKLEVGDPAAGDLFELHAGTVLCTVHHRGEARRARAAGYTVHVHAADFGLRLAGAAVKAAGPVPAGSARLTVAVRSGSLEVGDNGNRAVVEADERVVLSPGEPPERSLARDDPLYRDLLGRVGREVIPGYFDVETGVAPISRAAWVEEEARKVLVLTDPGPATVARYLVLQVEAAGPQELRVTRVRPLAERPGRAEAVTVAATTDASGILVVPLDAFDSPEAARAEREVPPGRSRLVRLELGTSLRLKASLWAAHPPAGRSEVIR